MPKRLPAVDWDRIKVLDCRPKVRVYLRLDPEVVEYFERPSRRGYQTRISTVLLSFVSHAMQEELKLSALARAIPKKPPRAGRSKSNGGGNGDAVLTRRPGRPKGSKNRPDLPVDPRLAGLR